jgi:hypothetical protein
MSLACEYVSVLLTLHPDWIKTGQFYIIYRYQAREA